MICEINLESIKNLLTFETDCDHIVSVLDEVIFAYIDGVLNNSNRATPGWREGDNVHWMRALRDAVWRAAHTDKNE